MRSSPEQRVASTVSILQSEAYDWWKLCLEASKVSGPYALVVLCPRVKGKVCHQYVQGGQMEAISEFEANKPING